MQVKLGQTNAGEDGQIQPEAKVDAFLDEIEGETLGQMLEYLSSELDSSEDSEVVRKRRSQQIDHVFCEITKVTQSAVDRYVDGILLNTIYKKAGVEAGKGGYTNFLKFLIFQVFKETYMVHIVLFI